MADHVSTWKRSFYRNLRLAGIGLLLATAGAGLAFSIDYGPHNPWSYFALALGVTGIGIGGFAITRARAEALGELRRLDREAAERRARRRLRNSN